MAASKYYLNDSGTNEVIDRLKRWANASFALKSAITDDGKVVYYNELPSSLPYASSGTHTAVSHGDHTHSYVPIAGNGIEHPMTGKIVVSAGTGGMRAILYNLNSSGTGTTQSQNQTNLISMTTSNIIQVGGQASDNSASSPTAPARLELYGGNARIIYAPLSSIQFNVGYGIWYHNNNVSPSTSIRAMTIDREGTSNVYNLNIGEAVNHTQTYIYGGSGSKVNVKSSEIILDTDRGVSFAVSSTIQADGIRLVSTGAEVVVSLGGRTGHGRTYIYGGSTQSVRIEGGDLLVGRYYSTSTTGRPGRIYLTNTIGTRTNRNVSFSSPLTSYAAVYVLEANIGTQANPDYVGMLSIGNKAGYDRTLIAGGETQAVEIYNSNLVIEANRGIQSLSDELTIYHGASTYDGVNEKGELIVTPPTGYVNIDTGNLRKYLVEFLPKATKDLFGDVAASLTYTNEDTIQSRFTPTGGTAPEYHYELQSTYDGRSMNTLSENSRYYIFRMGPRYGTSEVELYKDMAPVRGLSDNSIWNPAYEEALLTSYTEPDGNNIYTHRGSYFYQKNAIDHISTRMSGYYEIKLTVRGRTTNGRGAHLIINVWAKYAKHLRNKNGTYIRTDMPGDQLGITYASGAEIPVYPHEKMVDVCTSRNSLSFPETTVDGVGSSRPMYQAMSIFRSFKITGSTEAESSDDEIAGSDGYYYSTDAVGIYIQYSPLIPGGADTLILDHVALTLTRLNYIR